MANKRYTLLQIKNKKSQNNFFYCIPDQGKYVLFASNVKITILTFFREEGVFGWLQNYHKDKNQCFSKNCSLPNNSFSPQWCSARLKLKKFQSFCKWHLDIAIIITLLSSQWLCQPFWFREGRNLKWYLYYIHIYFVLQYCI